jgi:23S rRNA (cytosine1962-C5)-methyltransferase
MFLHEEYELLDFGAGRRLERFGEIMLDRPCPAAEPFAQANLGAWSQAAARFDGRDQEKGQWTDRKALPERWTIGLGDLKFELKRTDFGHLGIFPEQTENWKWTRERVSALTLGAGQGEGRDERDDHDTRGPHPLPLSQRERGESETPISERERGATSRPKVLNLFAYTGGSTLAAAAAGAEVTHVDAAKNIVVWARRNAELSDLATAPIRWIVEDAVKFVKRELKRGNRYDAVILDPPSYGHGPRGEVWRLSRHLPRLLSMCAELTAGRLQFMLLTCHTPGYDAEQLCALLTEHVFTSPTGWLEGRPLSIQSSDGRLLPSGGVVQWRRIAKE